MTNEELVARIQAGIDTADNMLELWQQNQGIIRRIAGKFKAYENIEDLTQQGYICLCNAVESYRAGEGVPFVIYAALCIRQGLYRYVQECAYSVRLPEGVRGALNEIKRFCAAFEREIGRRPTEKEIRLNTGYTQEKLRLIEKASQAAQMKSLDAPVPGDESGELTLADTVQDPKEDMCDVAQRLDEERLRALLWPMVDELPQECGAVLRLHYQEGATMNEIGQRIGVSMGAAQQWERKALSELRKPSRARRLRPYLSEARESVAYHTGGAALFHQTWTSSTERAALVQ